jgi:anti-sigma regulatory factor (Ser/Thr protein kinase)
MNCPTVAASTPIAPRTGDGVLPLNSRLELAALLTAPGCARAHVRAILLEWGLPDVAETAELLVSELVTNSLQASGRLKTRADLPLVPVIRLWVASDRVSVAIHVWDASDDLPIRRDADVDEISGRGLMIIDTLAKDWGSYRQASGKVVWAVVGREAAGGRR